MVQVADCNSFASQKLKTVHHINELPSHAYLLTNHKNVKSIESMKRKALLLVQRMQE